MAKEKINMVSVSDKVVNNTGDRMGMSFFSTVKGLCLLLFLISLAVYGNTLLNGYAVDDLAMIEKNVIVQKGFEGVPELMVTPRLAGFDRNIVNENYRPLSLVMFAVEYQLFGLNPFTGHLFNILFFGGCVVLLFLFLIRLFPGRQWVWFIACLLFAVHPIHTEVVANIKSRDELMSFFFGFSSLLVFMGYQQQCKPWKLLVGALLLMLAILSKETVISFVIIIPMLFYAYLNEHKRRSHMIVAATLAVAAVFLIIRQTVLKGHDTTAVPFLDNPLAGAAIFTQRIPTALLVLGMYLKLMVVPWPLISDYSYNTIPTVGFGNLWVWCSVAIYLIAGFIMVYLLWKKPKDPLAYGILFYLANLALFSNLFFLVYSEMAERLAFFASAGYCICAAILLFRLFPVADHHHGPKQIPVKLRWLFLPVALVFSILTINRNGDWKNDTDLINADLKNAPGNARLWHSSGSVKVLNEPPPAGTGDTTNRPITRAGIADLQQSLAIYPDDYKTHLDIGNYYRSIGQYDSAEYHIKQTLRILPNLSVAQSDLGFVYFSEQKYSEALALARTAYLQDTQNPTIMFNMGMIFIQMNELDSARVWMLRTKQLQPDNKMAADYLNLLQNALQNAMKKAE